MGAPLGNKYCVGRKLSAETKEKISKAKKGKFRKKTTQALLYQARLVWMEYWNKKVPEGYVVHHVDRNRENNDISNLALVTRGYHNWIHKYGNPR